MAQPNQRILNAISRLIRQDIPYERFLEVGSKETGILKDSGDDISLPALRRICGQTGSTNRTDKLEMIKKMVITSTNSCTE